MPETIRITDFTDPEYTDAALAGMQMIEQVPFDLSVDGVIAAAREQLEQEGGATLFEDDDWTDRLRFYLECVGADANYTTMGRFTTFNSLVRFLVQRSRLEALYAEHPEIDELEIERPLIIAGLPRSGTTHLLNLIGADPRLRALRRWESQEPIPSAAARAGRAPDDRVANSQAVLDQMDLVMPLMTNMYDVPNDGIHEEVDLQHMCLSSLLMAAGQPVTPWMDAYFAEDQRPHYAFLKRALKALQFLEAKERWVLKSPQHLGWLPALVDTLSLIHI